MMMMIKKYLAGIFLFLSALPALSQSNDFGIWYSVGLKHEIGNKLELNVSAVVRTFENAGRVDQGFLEAGVDYKLLKFLNAGLYYRLSDALEDDSKYHIQHKLFLDVRGTAKLSDLSLSARLRFQSRFRTYFEYVDDKIPDYTLRLKLKAGYNTPSFPVNPYVYYEPFFPLNKDPERVLGKFRAAAGIEFKISKKHSIDAEYIFERDYLPDISNINLISLSYNFKF
jgi:hypothetical protein